MTIAAIKRPQVIDQATIDEIRGVLDQAERGEVTGLVFAANMADDGTYFRVSDFANGWHILGALEYAKDSILKAMIGAGQ
jgi:hypothetical protein